MNKRKRKKIIKELMIPNYILQDRTLSILEAIVEYLFNIKRLSYHEIAVLINRDDRTIWTCYHRAQIKRK